MTVRECHGAAGDPEAACTTETQLLSAPVTTVDQCNDATNGGGGTLRCSVRVTSLFDSDPAPTGATVNQCVGSGDGDGTGCDPFPATTTGAAITQCNGSANGGTLVQLSCTATGTATSALAVTINQCNDSTNGGGGLVICSATLESRLLAPLPTATPTGSPVASPSGGPVASASVSAPATTLPPTSAASPGAAAGGSLAILPIVLGLMSAASLLLVGSRRVRGR